MSRIMLIVPPLRTNAGDLKKSAVNLGLWHIGSYLQFKGNEVRLLCADFGDEHYNAWNNPRECSGDYPGAAREYGLPDNEIYRRIKDFNPDIIGINSLATVCYLAVLKTASIAKEAVPHATVLAGGAHVTALPEKVLRDSRGDIDYAVLGEGEYVMERAAELYRNSDEIRKLPGVSFISNGSYHHNPRGRLVGTNDPEAVLRKRQTSIGVLDELGFLDPKLVEGVPFTPEPTYAGTTRINGGPTRKYMDVFFSRGCPLQCAFCFTPDMWGQNFRTYSPEHIRRQLEIFRKAGIEHIIVQDDNFSRGGGWTYDVMDIFGEMGFTWDNNGGLEVENLTPEIIYYMRKTGATTLFLPFNFRSSRTESIPERKNEHYRKILGCAKERGVYVYGSFIVGFPEQTMADMEKQVAFAKELREEGYADWITLYAFSVLPGTRRWMELMKPLENGEWEPRKETGICFEGGHWNWGRYSINTPQIGMDGLYERTGGKKGFRFDDFNKRYYEWIVEINGIEKARQWFNGKEWPK